MRKIYCISRAVPTLPINIEDASRSEAEIEEALKVNYHLLIAFGGFYDLVRNIWTIL